MSNYYNNLQHVLSCNITKKNSKIYVFVTKTKFLSSVRSRLCLCFLLINIIYIFFMPYAHAVGFGYMHIKSKLDEPLVAEIEVIGKVLPGSIIEIAGPEEYAEQNLDYSDDLSQASIKLVAGAKKSILRITTAHNFKEPVVHLILKLNHNEQNISIKKIFIKFIDLSSKTVVNTAKLVDTSINPSAELATPSNVQNITKVKAKDEVGLVQINSDKQVVFEENNDNTSNPQKIIVSDDKKDSIDNEKTQNIQSKANIYINKDTYKQRNKNKDKDKKIEEIKQSEKVLKNISISERQTAKSDSVAQSKNSRSNDGSTKKNVNIPTLLQTLDKKPTLKLDGSSAVELLQRKLEEKNIALDANKQNISESGSAASLTGLATTLNLATNTNTNTNASASGVSALPSLQNNATKNLPASNTTKSEKNNLNNKENADGLLHLFNANLTHTIKKYQYSNWFYIIIITFVSLIIGILYALYFRKNKKNIQKNMQKELSLFQEALHMQNNMQQSNTQHKITPSLKHAEYLDDLDDVDNLNNVDTIKLGPIYDESTHKLNIKNQK